MSALRLRYVCLALVMIFGCYVFFPSVSQSATWIDIPFINSSHSSDHIVQIVDTISDPLTKVSEKSLDSSSSINEFQSAQSVSGKDNKIESFSWSQLLSKRDRRIQSYILSRFNSSQTLLSESLVLEDSLNLDGGEIVGRMVDVQGKQLELCRAETFGFEFLCDKSWPIRLVGAAVIIRIDKDPAVAMILEKINRPIFFIEDFDTEFIKKNKIYLEGFSLKRVKLPHLDAVKIIGRPRVKAKAQHVDFYFIHQGQLFGLFFEITPADQLYQYMDIIKYISHSFRML